MGEDGSPGSAAALRWAFQDAARRGVAVHVVRAWSLANSASLTAAAQGLPFGTVPSFEQCEATVLTALQAEVSAAQKDAATPDVPVHLHVVHGPAAHALLAAAREADVLVVGERGIGGFLGLLLGSTAEQVLRHARCTVAVVRS